MSDVETWWAFYAWLRELPMAQQERILRAIPAEGLARTPEAAAAFLARGEAPVIPLAGVVVSTADVRVRVARGAEHRCPTPGCHRLLIVGTLPHPVQAHCPKCKRTVTVGGDHADA